MLPKLLLSVFEMYEFLRYVKYLYASVDLATFTCLAVRIFEVKRTYITYEHSILFEFLAKRSKVRIPSDIIGCALPLALGFLEFFDCLFQAFNLRLGGIT